MTSHCLNTENEHKKRDTKNSLKWGGKPKIRAMGNVWNRKDSFAEKSKEKRTFFKFWADNTTLTLLINITRDILNKQSP